MQREKLRFHQFSAAPGSIRSRDCKKKKTNQTGSQKDVEKNTTQVQDKEFSICERYYMRNSILAELPSSANTPQM